MNRDERIVVVGGGLTGLRAAERLRELKFEGEITILGDEKLPPYHRPALSKQLLKGELRSSDLTLPAYEDLNARWRFGTQVRQLIPTKKTLVLPGGEEMTYDGLIIATGVEAGKQSGVPYHDPRVLVLRTMSDGLDLERVLGSTKGRVAVIGGGFTGCELAASLRHLSRDVTLIGRGKNLLGNVLGPELGEWLTGVHRDHGVDLALGNSVEEWNPTAEGIGLKLTDGSTLMVSCVILAAGTRPMTHWLRGSGLPLDNGVVCEATCHVVGADDVVAAGDVAQWPNLRFDNVPRRVEHWLNAVEMGRACAESLLAGRENAQPFCPMPRFWTDQYSYRIQAAGMIKLGKDIVKLGTPDEGTGTVYGYSLEGRLMAVAGVDCPSAMIAWSESLSRQNPEPRREEVETPTKLPITVGGGSLKKRPGKHLAPPREKQFQRPERQEQEIGFVEQPQPAEVSGPIGVGAGQVPAARAQSVVDSFSRMLPVAVRPPYTGGPIPPARPAGPPRMIGGRTLPTTGVFPPVPTHSSGPLSLPPGHPSGPLPVPPISAPPANGFAGGPRGPFGDGAASSGVFPKAAASGTFPSVSNGRPVNASGPAGGPGGGRSGPNGLPRGGATVPPMGAAPFGTPSHPPALGPATGHTGTAPREPEFSAAEMTDVRGPLPEPLSGRLGPDAGLAIDVTGQMALLDANGHVRAPEFSDVPPRRGPSDSFGGVPAIRRAAEESFSAMPPARRGPQDSFSALPPAGRGPEESFSRMPAVRGPQDSFNAMPPVRRGADEPAAGASAGRRSARGPQDSFSALPPAGRGPEESFSRMPAVRGPQDSISAMPPVRRGGPEESVSRMPAVRGPQDSFNALPPARRGGHDSAAEESVSRMPAVRGPQDSFNALPPARRSAHDSAEESVSRMPAVRGPQDSFSAMPPVRRGGAEESVSRMPAVRGPQDSFNAMPPVRRGAQDPAAGASAGRRSARGPQDSFSALPPAGRGPEESFSRMPAVRGPQDSFSALPPARRGSSDDGPETSITGMPPVRRSAGPQDSFSALPPVRRDSNDVAETSVTGMAPVSRGGRRRAEDSYSRLPVVDDSHRPAHRAEDLTPEFGRPPKRRNVNPDLSGVRMVPALSSMDDSIEMPAVRMPKHGRPEDYGVPSSRPGPEDSYDHMPAVERPTGGRRRARA
ncbi:FAD-dependent oxidoreductase [Actinophytocola sp.]|uniref:FAD-dependent oxidoreductase n=1 Tax=Actinophytocola sp. TaxID=1872138 RepID=UPI003899C739